MLALLPHSLVNNMFIFFKNTYLVDNNSLARSGDGISMAGVETVSVIAGGVNCEVGEGETSGVSQFHLLKHKLKRPNHPQEHLVPVRSKALHQLLAHCLLGHS